MTCSVNRTEANEQISPMKEQRLRVRVKRASEIQGIHQIDRNNSAASTSQTPTSIYHFLCFLIVFLFAEKTSASFLTRTPLLLCVFVFVFNFMLHYQTLFLIYKAEQNQINMKLQNLLWQSLYILDGYFLTSINKKKVENLRCRRNDKSIKYFQEEKSKSASALFN